MKTFPIEKQVKKRTVKSIEKEMTELYPKKELAYIDYRDNAGDEETGPRLFQEFEAYRNRWNQLVTERKALL